MTPVTHACICYLLAPALSGQSLPSSAGAAQIESDGGLTLFAALRARLGLNLSHVAFSAGVMEALDPGANAIASGRVPCGTALRASPTLTRTRNNVIAVRAARDLEDRTEIEDVKSRLQKFRDREVWRTPDGER
jgi:hypothetical protein